MQLTSNLKNCVFVERFIKVFNHNPEIEQKGYMMKIIKVSIKNCKKRKFVRSGI